ncbi:hypothetical protein SLEP1_g7275 [Rubroshorea leprosula]|uniref:Uncharacterized protein n=1 Tax=Rubroshorea leprosula TaxID=152421 RepID=A0AAV5I445_9ROSI|nr:hypothetical protein SLEP1_g7275 [Rubroshorea leprosula]
MKRLPRTRAELPSPGSHPPIRSRVRPTVDISPKIRYKRRESRRTFKSVAIRKFPSHGVSFGG